MAAFLPATNALVDEGAGGGVTDLGGSTVSFFPIILMPPLTGPVQ